MNYHFQLGIYYQMKDIGKLVDLMVDILKRELN